MSEVALVTWLTLASLLANDAEAKRLVVEARADYEHHEFERSLKKYAEAYALWPEPRLLFNIGQCHRKLGQHARAVQYFQRFLDSGEAEAPQARVTAELIIEERRMLFREETARQLEATRRFELEASLKQAAAAPLPVTRQWWFWTALGAVAVAGVTTGLVLGLAPRPTPTTYPDINAR